MVPRSLALVTELAIAAMRGRVTDRGDYLVVETPGEPGWGDGNYLVLPAEGGDVATWTRQFQAELGATRAISLRWDDPTGAAAQRATGFTIDHFELLAADEVLAPPHALPISELSAAEITATADLSWAVADHHDEPYRQFLRRRAVWQAELVTSGRARFYGAYDRDRLVASLGLVRIAPGLARYQDVQTAASHRRRGLAGALLATAWRDAGSRVAILAAPGSDASRVYRRVGFVPVEKSATASRRPLD